MATQITDLPTPPQRTDDQVTFTTRADAWVGALTTWTTQTNTLATEVESNADSALLQATNAANSAANAALSETNAANSAVAAANSANSAQQSAGGQATSTTSLTIGTGSKTFTIQSGKAFVPGMFVIAAQTTTPSNYMYGQVTSYSGTSLIVNVTNTSGSGTINAWSISVSNADVLATFASIEVLSISANTSLTNTSKNVVRVNSTVRASSVLLPSGTSLVGKNGVFIVKNIGDFALPVRDQSGDLLSILPKGATGIYTLEDGSTSAGIWGVVAPESRPAMAYAAAVVEASGSSWQGISDIPGVTNKALTAWISGTNLKVAIATRNPSTGAMTIGTPLTVTNAINQSSLGMVKALSSTTALVAGVTGANAVYSLTLNTSTDTVTTTGNASTGTNGTIGKYEHAQQLDATRVAWLSTNSSALFLNIASYAATPTIGQTNLNTAGAALDIATAAMVHVGSGILSCVSSDSAAILTTSGNTATVASTSAGFNDTVPANVGIFGFAPGSGNKATFAGALGETAAYGRDYSFAVEPTGITLSATSVNKVSSFPSAPLQRSSLSGFVAGSSYCMVSQDVQVNAGLSVRVMRYTDSQLTEVASGAPEGMPPGRNAFASGASTRVAAVGGQACIVLNRNRSAQPQVFSMEVIKA